MSKETEICPLCLASRNNIMMQIMRTVIEFPATAEVYHSVVIELTPSVTEDHSFIGTAAFYRFAPEDIVVSATHPRQLETVRHFANVGYARSGAGALEPFRALTFFSNGRI